MKDDLQYIKELVDERDKRYQERYEALKQLMDERNERYQERDAANKAAVQVAFANSEKFAAKTEAALVEYKTGANEWRDTVKDLIANLNRTQPPVWMKVSVVTVVVALIGFVVTVALFLLK